MIHIEKIPFVTDRMKIHWTGTTVKTETKGKSEETRTTGETGTF